MDNNLFIETPRLIIKKLNAKDYPYLRMQQKDPYIMEFFGGPREDKKIDEVLALLFDHLEKYGFSQGPAFLKESGECIGRAGLVHLDFKPVPDVELAYFVLQPFTNKGYATELGEAFIEYAFGTLKLKRVFATVDSKNIASCRVSEKLGMIFDRDDVYETLNKTVRFYIKNKPLI